MTYYSHIRGLLYILIAAVSLIAANVGAQSTGGAVLRWTAPGDDGYTGQASGYDIRYQPFSSGPLNTEAEWSVASRILSLPFPSLAGQIDSVLVTGLSIGAAYYFALRAYDEVNNYSQISNSPVVVMAAVECCTGLVGNVNGQDGDAPTISDVSMLIDHVFLSNRPVWCPAEADINQSGGTNPEQGPGGDITISDITIMIDHLFITGRALPACY